MAYLTQLAMWTLLREILQEVKKMSGSLDGLTTQIASTDSVIASAVTMIQGFAAQLAAAGTDPTKLAALQSDLQSHTQALADAVAANTPAAQPSAPASTPPASAPASTPDAPPAAPAAA